MLLHKLRDYLESHPEFTTRGGVSLMYFETREELILSSRYPGFFANEIPWLELNTGYISLPSMIELFQLQTISQIQEISPHHLLDAYQNGKANLWCFIDGDCRSLIFKQEASLQATPDGRNWHIIERDLDSIQDLISYACIYFTWYSEEE